MIEIWQVCDQCRERWLQAPNRTWPASRVYYHLRVYTFLGEPEKKVFCSSKCLRQWLRKQGYLTEGSEDG